MKKNLSLLLLPFFAAFIFVSCVSTKKYHAALARDQNLTSENASLSSTIAELNSKLTNTEGENARLVKQIDDALKNAKNIAGQANMTQEQLQAEQKKLSDMMRLMDQQRQATESLRKKMADALVNFKSNELSVVTKNGKVYVSMQESLLFPSGSAAVNPKGKEAIGQLAQVLNTNPDINVNIEGHTDSIPIKGKFADNWALSVARATSIVRVLTDSYGVDPTRVTASGRSKYDPIDSNDTPEGRARNRRTEVILEPKLDELMRLLNPTPDTDSTTTTTMSTSAKM